MRWHTAALILGALPATLRGQGDRGHTVMLLVTAAGTGAPVAYADVHVQRTGFRALANAQGEVSVWLADTATVRVRRLGFQPATLLLRASAGDSVRVALEVLTLELARIRVTEKLCPGDVRNDTTVVAILEQVRMNGERSRLLADEYPYESTLEREFANVGYGDGSFSRRTGARHASGKPLRLDTVYVRSRHGWRYRPGNLIVPNDRQLPGLPYVREKMILPQLPDFADDVFIGAHCFRFAGLEEWEGKSVFRVDFEPAPAVRTPDVSGSLYFSASGYQIVRSSLRTERPSSAAAGDTWHVQVETLFMEFLPGLPLIEYVESTTRVSSPIRGRQQPGRLAAEVQRLLTVEFLEQRPGETPPR